VSLSSKPGADPAATITWTPGARPVLYWSVPDPRKLASDYVDQLKGQRGKDGRKLTWEDRIRLAANQHGLDFDTLNNWLRRSKHKR
jgi:hypothetical protein